MGQFSTQKMSWFCIEIDTIFSNNYEEGSRVAIWFRGRFEPFSDSGYYHASANCWHMKTAQNIQNQTLTHKVFTDIIREF